MEHKVVKITEAFSLGRQKRRITQSIIGVLLLAFIFIAGYFFVTKPQQPTFTKANPPTPTITWTDASGDHNWDNGSNWDTLSVPAITDDVLIPSGSATLTIPNDTDVTVNSLTLDGSSVLTVGSVNTGTLQAGDPIISKLVVTTDIYLLNSSTMTTPSNTATTTTPYTLNLDIGGSLSIDATSSIDVSGKGYAGVAAPSSNPGISGANVGACINTGAVGGQHGGQSGIYTYCTRSEPYGDPTAPVDLGSGGRSRAASSTSRSADPGGGSVRINATNIEINGAINANGPANTVTSGYHAGGSGGSVYITASNVSGSGIISANGGSVNTTYHAPGSGGRIAVVATSSNSLSDSQSQALSGSRAAGGYDDALAAAAGTIYLSENNNTKLIVDNDNHTTATSTAYTSIPASLSPFYVDDLVMTNGGRLTFDGDLEFVNYVFGTYSAFNVTGSVTYSTTEDFIIDGSNFFLNIGGFINNNSGTSNNGNLIIKNTTDDVANLNININSNQIFKNIEFDASSSILTVNGNLVVKEDFISSAGTTEICSITATTSGSGAGLTTTLGSPNVTATNLTLNGSAVLTHCANGAADTNLKTLYLDITENLSIGVNASIDVTGKGYDGIAINGSPGVSGANSGSCTANGTVGGQYGGHSGYTGNCARSEPYGDPTAPVDMGSGGRSRSNYLFTATAGGGAVRINAPNVEINGAINTNGIDNTTAGNTAGYAFSAGSGGSVYITATNVSGSGGINANGGSTTGTGASSYYGPGSGGRISVVVTGANSLADSQFQAYSGARGNGNYGSVYAAAAGTIYLKGQNNKTKLIIDNDNHTITTSTAYTSVSAIPSPFYVDDLIITNGGRLTFDGNLEFTDYTFGSSAATSSYSTLDITGSVTYNAEENFIIEGSNFFLNVGSFINNNSNVNNNGSLIIKNTTDNIANVTISINSSQTIENIEIDADSSTITVNGNLIVTEDVSISNTSSANTLNLNDTLEAKNLTISNGATINGRVEIEEDILLNAGITTICSITASTSGSGAELITTLSSPNIIADNLVLEDSAVLTHCENVAIATDLNTLYLDITNTLTIDSTASIDVTGKGYAGISINGAPGISGANIGACSSNGAIGGQYGGHGGLAGSCTRSEPYGDLAAPVDMGSGGRSRSNASNFIATAGGGAVRIDAANVVVNGSINTNGANNTLAVSSTNTTVPAGAGGSVYITADNVSGNGSISANGGSTTGTSTSSLFGPGSGGRISVAVTGTNSFSNSQYQAYSGAKGNGNYNSTFAAAAGTIYLKDQNNKTKLIIDNDNHTTTTSTAYTVINPSLSPFFVDDLVIVNGGRLTLDGDLEFADHTFGSNAATSSYSTLNVSGSVTYSTTEDFIIDGSNFFLNIGSFINNNSGTNNNGNFAVKNTIDNVINLSVNINSTQTFKNVEIDADSSTFTVNGNFIATEDVLIANTSSISTFNLADTLEARNLTISNGVTVNGKVGIEQDITIESGITTVCFVTATTTGSGAGLTTTLGNPNVIAANLILEDSAILTHCENGATDTNLKTLYLSITEDLTIDSASSIDVVGKGYTGVTSTASPGLSGANIGTCSNNGAIGGQYGGHSGLAGSCTRSEPYGDLTAPVDLGSGSRNRTSLAASVTAGGGGVRIEATNIELNGSINSNGVDNTITGTSTSHSISTGSGGSVYITAVNVSGNGNISANGGNIPNSTSASPYYGPGSGGRISVTVTSTNSLSDSNIQAHSGSKMVTNGYNNALAAAAGTIYLKDQNNKTKLIIDNDNHTTATSTAYTVINSSLLPFFVDDLVIVNGGRLTLDGDIEFADYTFEGNLGAGVYSTLNVTGSVTYSAIEDFVIYTSNFTLNMGSFINNNNGTNNNGNLVVDHPTENLANLTININSAQTFKNIDFNADSSIFVINGDLIVDEYVFIDSDSSTFTINGNLLVTENVSVTNTSSISTFNLTDTLGAKNLNILNGVTINGRVEVEEDIILNSGTTTICSITASTSGSGAELTTTLNNPNVIATNLILEDSATLTHCASGATDTSLKTLYLNITDSLSIDATSSIDVSGKGYAGVVASSGSNPGSSGANVGACSNNGAIGGQYGGHGGITGSCTRSDSYGDLTAPVDLGSGGRSRLNYTSATAGGGSVRINATNVEINGYINVNGVDNTGTGGSVYYAFSAGSGGSVYITANNVSGSGSISANGGSTTGTGTSPYYGPGGGGRIAVAVANASSLTDSQFQAYSGSRTVGGYNNALAAAAGTIYLKDQNNKTKLIIDNDNHTTATSTAYTVINSSLSPFFVDDLVIVNGGRLSLDGDLEFVDYIFEGNLGAGVYSTLNVTGSVTYNTTENFVIDASNFFLNIGDFVNNNNNVSDNGNLIVKNTTENIANVNININSTQTFENIEFNANSSTFTVNGNLIATADVFINAGSSTFTINGNLTATGDVVITNTSSASTFNLADTLIAENLTVSNNTNINGRVEIEKDFLIEAGTTTMCFSVASTSGSGTGLATVLNRTNVVAGNLILNNSAILTHCANTATTATPYTLNLDISGTLSINSDASIDVVGKGYAGVIAGQSNPGTSGANTGICTDGVYSAGAIGGQYGGQGGLSGSCAVSEPYGDPTAPVDLGSGGRGRYWTGANGVTPGGGAIRIVATNIEVNGNINANGADNTSGSGSSTGFAAGAGGSVYITAANISGSGNISANGGSTTGTVNVNYGPGGGGRISVTASDSNSLTESQYQAYSGARAYGGYNNTFAAAAGTIYLKDQNNKTKLVIDNDNHSTLTSTAYTGVPASYSPLYVDDFILVNGGRLVFNGDLEFANYIFDAGGTLNVSGSLTYSTTENFVIDTSNFFLNISSFINNNANNLEETEPGVYISNNGNLIVKDTTDNLSNVSVTINSTQTFKNIEIDADSSTFTTNGNLIATGDVFITNTSSASTFNLTDTLIAENLTVSNNTTINGRVEIEEDIILEAGTTTICSITASTSGSSTELTTTLSNPNVIADNITLEDSAVLTHCTNGAADTNLKTLHLSVTSDLLIDANASIDVVGKGYAGVSAGQSNPGTSGANIGYCQDGYFTTGAIGGQYGGQGGLAGSCAVSGTYGDPTAPVDLGSGGRSRSWTGARDAMPGGGAIRIVATNVEINGNINANGANYNGSSSGDGFAAGAGGSIYITATNVSGSGSISANGGSTIGTLNINYGPGGGGRIAVVVSDDAYVEEVEPDSGPLMGGNTVVISGENFVDGVTEFYFGDNPATNINIIDQSTASVTVPSALWYGVVNVTATNNPIRITADAGTRAAGSGTLAENGTIYPQREDLTAFDEYTYLEPTITISLDDDCSNNPNIDLIPTRSGVVSNIKCTADIENEYPGGYSLLFSLSEEGLDTDSPLNPITNGTTSLPATYTDPVALRANMFGFAVPRIQTNTTGLIPSGFDDDYPLASSTALTSHQYKYAAISEFTDPTMIKATTLVNSMSEPTDVIVGTSADFSMAAGYYTVPVVFTAIANL